RVQTANQPTAAAVHDDTVKADHDMAPDGLAKLRRGEARSMHPAPPALHVDHAVKGVEHGFMHHFAECWMRE
ncbi:hypothetical protein, partial [Sulfitobacter sp. HI0021]|uniref:hypothetical protein n=1 Tax=Sulfitobacter sp. HI0021 TaxID=1822224 RepID=UPI001F2846F1